MLVNRSNGLAKAVAIALMVGNAAVFMLVRSSWEQLPGHEPANPAPSWVYAGIVVFGVLHILHRLIACRTWLMELSVVERLVLSLRMMFGHMIGAAVIYFALGSMPEGRLFLLLFVLLTVPVNFVLLGLVPPWLVRRFFPANGRSRAVLVGSGPVPPSLVKYLHRCEMLGVEVVGHYGEAPASGARWEHLGGIGDLFDRLAESSAEKPADGGSMPDCILAFGFDQSDAAFSLLTQQCWQNGIRLQAYARLANSAQGAVKLVSDGDLNFLVFLDEPLQDPLNRLCKRTLDLLLAVPVVLFVLPWLTLWVWAMHRRQSPGPLLFKQLRRGADRKPFYIYKFRTMHAKASDHGYAFRQATVGDARIFPLGGFLRRTSIDEFPQFINVLRGEMSIVGPRPHPMKLDDDMEREMLTYRSRHFVRPGITGYAQVLGLRGETPDSQLMFDRVKKDIEYISGWSLTFDLKIILQTTWQIFSPRGRAY